MPKTKKQVSLADKTRELITYRTELETMKADFKKQTEPLEQVIAGLTEEIKTEMKANHMASFRTDFGTPYLSIRRTAYVADEAKVIAWLKSKKLEKEYTAIRLTDKFTADYLRSDTKAMVKVDGVEIKESESFGVRKSNEHDTKTETGGEN